MPSPCSPAVGGLGGRRCFRFHRDERPAVISPHFASTAVVFCLCRLRWFFFFRHVLSYFTHPYTSKYITLLHSTLMARAAHFLCKISTGMGPHSPAFRRQTGLDSAFHRVSLHVPSRRRVQWGSHCDSMGREATITALKWDPALNLFTAVPH